MYIALLMLFCTTSIQIILDGFYKYRFSKIIEKSEHVKAIIVSNNRKISFAKKYVYKYIDYKGTTQTGHFGDLTTNKRDVGDGVEIIYALSEPSKSIALEFKPKVDMLIAFCNGLKFSIT